MEEETVLFDVNLVKRESIKKTLGEISEDLEFRGYNAINQIAGYLISGDPGYISSYNNARKKIVSLDRSELIAIILEDFLKKN